MTAPTFSHLLRSDVALELHYTADSRVTIHAKGCKHPAEATRSFDVTNAAADDFFNVAPCARATK